MTEVRAGLRAAITAIREAAKMVRDVTGAVRQHERRIRTLEKTDRRRNIRLDSMGDVMRMLTRLAATQSQWLDHLEGEHG
jgi:hypothetical protein